MGNENNQEYLACVTTSRITLSQAIDFTPSYNSGGKKTTMHLKHDNLLVVNLLWLGHKPTYSWFVRQLFLRFHVPSCKIEITCGPLVFNKKS